jgi:hypothetical protein
MENAIKPLEELFEKVQDYTKSSANLYKLQALNMYSDVASTLATQFVIFCIITMCVVAVNIGLALWLGSLLGETYYGFFSVAGFYLILGIIIYRFKKQWIKTPVQNTIITQMQKKDANTY